MLGLIIFLVIVAVGFLGLGLWLWWWFPLWQMRSITAADPKARADIEDNFRKTIGQALGGIFVLLGAGLAYYGTFQTLQANQDQARRSQEAAHDLLISNQVSKGFEQFGSENIRVRLGGIYALEGVMNASEQYHQPVLEALSAFVRDGTRNVTGDGPPATDIQAALAGIGRRAAIGTGRIDLANPHIPKAQLNDAHLSSADLSGADLTNADLSGAHLNGADLRGAHLRGFATSLSGAHLSGAVLSSANLNDANLTDANLTGAILNSATLIGATITQAQLDKSCGWGAKLDPGLTLNSCK